MPAPSANTNSWVASNNYVDVNSLTRTNPYAEEVNVHQLFGVDTFQTRHDAAFTWQASAAGAQLRIKPGTGATTATDYLHFRIVDLSGNEVYDPTPDFAASAATTTLVYNTSTLNMNDEFWTVQFNASNNSGATKVGWQFRIDSAAIAANSSGSESYTF